jgi:hypothetical protein
VDQSRETKGFLTLTLLVYVNTENPLIDGIPSADRTLNAHVELTP